MARASIRLVATIFAFVCLIQSNPATSTNSLINGGNRPSMVLPLYLSSTNISGSFTKSRHHLQRSDSKSHPNARMRLYDDLLLNGYYTTRLWIGTPPQTFSLIVDTGSTVTYVPCDTCEQCGDHQMAKLCDETPVGGWYSVNILTDIVLGHCNLQDPKFQPDLSSTYQPVKCNLDCNCDHERVQCVYERQYAEMSSSSGVLGEDIISFGNQSELAPQRAVFGCENVETGDLYSQHADGIMGLGRGDLSVIDQLVEKGVMSDSFSLCYGGMDIGGGAMVLGNISPPKDMVFTHSDPVRSPYYNIDLKAMQVAGKALPLNPRVFDGKHGTVLDSGTTYAYLPEAAFLAFKDAIMNELQSLKQIRGPDPNYNDICFSGAPSDVSELSNTFPTVEMVFGNGQKLLLSPENYLFQHSKVHGAYCLGIFVNRKDPTTLLGGIIVRNTLVMYDREHSKIGFWKTNCSELWERLQITSAPPPVPSSSEVNNSSAELPPSELPNYVLPDELQVGKILFDMSLSVNYSNLKPHFPELTDFIAQGLDVNISQVHLLKFMSKGNDSLITWAIFPSGPANYISNAMAMSIIFRLAKHRVHLPDTFGNYKLLQWKVEPVVKRTWWQQHFLTLVLAFIITVIAGLSVSAILFILRRRHQTINSYKPVDSALPEQELQPL